MESKKVWKKEVESLVLPVVAQEVHYKNQDWTLGLNFFLNFDYTVGLVCEYGNKYNL